jgi:hypothetical protein
MRDPKQDALSEKSQAGRGTLKNEKIVEHGVCESFREFI